MKKYQTIQDTLSDLRGDVTLIRLCLQGLMEGAGERRLEELYWLWRLSDHMEQHVSGAEDLLRSQEGLEIFPNFVYNIEN